MLEKLFKVEAGLLRVETWLLVSCVLLMLVLAGYTVFYRNVLIPWQNHLSTSGPAVVTQKSADDTDQEPAAADDGDTDGFGGGFGGGFGADDESEEDEADEAKEDQADGFGGGFGGGFAEEEEEEESDDGDDGFGGGFGGGFGADDESADEAAEAASDQDPAAETDVETDRDPEGGPPPEGSLAAWLVGFIDTVKAHWTDELLRQLVIICGFLGAMLAARQRNHITIDAVGTLLKGRPRHLVDTLTSVVAGVVCVFLAASGLRLVELGIEFPRQLLPFAKEWHLQLAFPIGWGMLAFHFMVRGVESAHLAHTFDDEQSATEVPVGDDPENLDETHTDQTDEEAT